MGTRLYPLLREDVASDVAKLEKLAGCKDGTYARLKATTARHDADKATWGKMHPADVQEREYDQWKEINDDDDMGSLDNFLTFGWGKFMVPDSLKPQMYDGDGYLTPGGRMEGEDALTLLEYNGIGDRKPHAVHYWTLDDIGGGVHWC